MAKTRKQKEELFEEYSNGLAESQAIFIVDSSKMSATQSTEVKLRLAELGGKFAVLKNTVFQKAYEKSPLKEISTEEVNGPTGVFFVDEKGDPSAVAKIIKEFNKEYEVLETKFGFFNNALLTPGGVMTLADLPSREELLAKTVYLIAAPVKNLLGVMNGATRDLVGVLNAIKEEKAAAA